MEQSDLTPSLFALDLATTEPTPQASVRSVILVSLTSLTRLSMCWLFWFPERTKAILAIHPSLAPAGAGLMAAPDLQTMLPPLPLRARH